MNLVLNIPDELAARIARGGGDPEALAVAALRQAADRMEAVPTAPRDPAAAARAAGARIRANRVGNRLPDGVSIRDLIEAGRD